MPKNAASGCIVFTASCDRLISRLSAPLMATTTSMLTPSRVAFASKISLPTMAAIAVVLKAWAKLQVYAPADEPWHTVFEVLMRYLEAENGRKAVESAPCWPLSNSLCRRAGEDSTLRLLAYMCPRSPSSTRSKREGRSQKSRTARRCRAGRRWPCGPRDRRRPLVAWRRTRTAAVAPGRSVPHPSPTEAAGPEFEGERGP